MVLASEIRAPAALFDLPAFHSLAGRPESALDGTLDGVSYSARIVIADYGERIASHYRDALPRGLAAASAQAGIPFDLPHFGLAIDFARPVILAVHDGDMVLDESIRALVARFGPVVFRNARMPETVADRFHRNIFPHLRFHVDRGPAMDNQYSCFSRDPTIVDQRGPRASSTLFIANIVAWLEQAGQLDDGAQPQAGVQPSYNLFHRKSMAPLFGNIILEQQWSAPEGTGEICVIDNRTVLHATYHKDGSTAGYPIGARYLF